MSKQDNLISIFDCTDINRKRHYFIAAYDRNEARAAYAKKFDVPYVHTRASVVFKDVLSTYHPKLQEWVSALNKKAAIKEEEDNGQR